MRTQINLYGGIDFFALSILDANNAFLILIRVALGGMTFYIPLLRFIFVHSF